MEQQLLLPDSQWRAVVPLIQSFTEPIPVSTSSSPAPCVWALAAILSLVLGCCHSGLGKPEGIVSTWGWFNYRESGLMGCSPLCAAMTPAHKAGDMPTAHECVLCIVLLLSDLCCATSYLENMGNRDHCTAFTLQYGRKEPLSRGFLPPFCSGWWCQGWLITCSLCRPLPVSPKALVPHKTVIQWWELGTKIENQ